MDNLTPEVMKFFIDNATGIGLGFAGMYMMYRLCDKHLNKISDRLEYLGDVIQTTAISQKTSIINCEKSLFHLNEQMHQLKDFN